MAKKISGFLDALIKSELPYCMWTCGNGRQVLFNRSYRPIWERAALGTAEPANRTEWMQNIVREEHYYTDWITDVKRLTKGRAVLASWGIRVASRTAPEPS